MSAPPVTQLLSSYLHLLLTLTLFSSFSPLSSSSSSCELQAQFQLSGTSQAGDVMLGGLFYINRFPVFYEGSFTSQPQDPICYSFNDDGFRWAQTMAFAIDEINREPSLLPNVTVGYTIYDTCYSLGVGYRAALSLASGREERFQLVESCKGSPPLLAIMGPDSSTNSIAISKLLGLYRVPVGLALAQLMKRFQWSWVGVLFVDNDYGRDAARLFQLAMDQSGAGCVAYMQVMPWDQDRAELQRIVTMMKRSTARVVIPFLYGTHAANVLDEVIRQNVSGLQWISEMSWQTDLNLQRPHFLPVLRGSVGLATRQGQIPGFKDFLLKIHPSNDPDISHGRSIVKQFWEHTFQCKFAPLPPEWADAGGRVCSGQEDLRAAGSALLHVSDLREEYNVYKGAYALAHALHDMLQCVPGRGPFPGHSCATLQTIQPWQLLYYLENVNFTTSFGDHVFFDENGDSTPIFDLMNWVWLPDGSINVHKVGVVKESASGNIELFLDKDIFWSFDSTEPPRSVCSESCIPGTRLARRIGQPVCCFDCIACPEGQISNETDSTECTVCPEDFWSSPQRDHCVLKSIEFLSYHEALGISLTTISLLGTFICAIVMGIFVYHRDTPMVRANNSELSFQLLLSLKLCFLCTLLFIGRPRVWTCQLRHAVFGISFVLCVSCILVKTMVVLAVFKASKPGGADIMKWFGAMQQRGTVLVLTAIQAIICIVWLVSASPFPHKNTQYYSETIVHECDVGSIYGFAVLLGYIGLLALLSFVLAFMARNLPDNFNEAKLITFSMLIFCAVWIAFIPAYVSSPGKYADVVEVFAILASGLGILMALFGPKCYIILLKPEKNTKKSIMGRGATKT